MTVEQLADVVLRQRAEHVDAGRDQPEQRRIGRNVAQPLGEQLWQRDGDGVEGGRARQHGDQHRQEHAPHVLPSATRAVGCAAGMTLAHLMDHVAHEDDADRRS